MGRSARRHRQRSSQSMAVRPGQRGFFRRWFKRLVIAGISVFLILPLLYLAIFRFVPVPMTSFMAWASIDAVLDKKTFVLRHDWMPLNKISSRLQRAVIASEDQNFLDHYGIDMDAMEKAFVHNQRSSRVRGASTISQQTCKNLFLWSGRSYVRKGLEAWLTLLMETMWSKQRILEVYLNSAEFGRGIYGAEAAAQFYFRKPAARLSAREAALLAAVLPAPRRRNPAQPSAYVQLRASWIEAQMVRLGPIERVFSAD